MEEKSTRLSNLMNNCKVNMDFLKNVNLPPIKLPKLKPPKMFSGKVPPSSKPYTIPPPQGSSFINRSPSRISTISSLSNNAPDLEDYHGFGHLSVSRSAIDLRSTRDEKIQKTKDGAATTRLTFSEKISKHCKEISEFKFSHLLGKQTVVRTTGIDVQNYSHAPEDFTSEISNHDFEFHSLPPGGVRSRDNSFDEDPQPTYKGVRRKWNKRQDSIESYDAPPPPKRCDSLDAPKKIEPNKSSLFKQVKAMSMKKIGSFDRAEKFEKVEKPPKEEAGSLSKHHRFSKMSFNRQSFEDGFNRAKSSVNSQIQKLRSLQVKKHNPEEHSPSKDKYKKKPDPDVIILPNITYGAENDGVIRSRSPPSNRPSRTYTAERQSSIEQSSGFTKSILETQDSTDDSENNETPYRSEASRRNVYEKRLDGDGFKDADEDNYLFRRPGTLAQHGSSVPPPVNEATYPSWLSHKTEHPPELEICEQSFVQTTVISRPAPPLPPPKPFVGAHPSGQPVSKVDIIRKRFSHKQNDSLTTHSGFSSQHSNDSDSWIPDTFKGMTQNRIHISESKETDKAWTTVPAKKFPLEKLETFDIFRTNSEEAFSDFEEALKNVPTVEVVVGERPVPPAKPKEKCMVRQASVVNEEEKSIVFDRRESVNKLVSRFEGSIESDDESIESVVRESKPNLNNMTVVEITNRIPILVTQSSKDSCEAQPVIFQEDLKAQINTDKEPSVVTKHAPSFTKMAERKLLKNEVTETTFGTESDDDEMFHSLDSSEEFTMKDARMVCQRRSMRVLYTAEV